MPAIVEFDTEYHGDFSRFLFRRKSPFCRMNHLGKCEFPKAGKQKDQQEFSHHAEAERADSISVGGNETLVGKFELPPTNL